VTYPQVGGHAALDLVDTVHWRLDPARWIDTLPTFDAVLAWGTQVGVLGDARSAALAGTHDPARADREYAAVIALREAIYSAVFEGSTDAAALIKREYVDAVQRSSWERSTDAASWSWRTPDDITGPRATVALLAHDLLASDLSAARQCGDDACGWVYLDTSPRGNRVWCTAAGCGNRNRVARHHARTKR
jgi:predicted RNA-binding Zn ribbon-like protein